MALHRLKILSTAYGRNSQLCRRLSTASPIGIRGSHTASSTTESETHAQAHRFDFDDTPPPAASSGIPGPAGIPAQDAQAKSSDAKRRFLRPRKAAINLSPTAVTQLQSLLSSPQPRLIRIGVRNRGCSGLAYHLEYVDKPGAFDEVVEQSGVKVLIDSRALFSIIGSEMDWQEDQLSSKFVFKNPNIKEQCGCGESFIV